MSVAAYETRREKLEWLTRPIEWAYLASVFGGIIGALMWYNGDVSIENIAAVAIGSNIIAAGLLLWGTVRLTNAAR